MCARRESGAKAATGNAMRYIDCFNHFFPRAFFDKIGFLKPLSTQLPEVAAPLWPRHWVKINTMTIAYGHGISVTPLRLDLTDHDTMARYARALGAIPLQRNPNPMWQARRFHYAHASIANAAWPELKPEVVPRHFQRARLAAAAVQRTSALQLTTSGLRGMQGRSERCSASCKPHGNPT